MDYLSRTRLLLNDDSLAKLASAHVAIFGVGGVGGAAVEALVRSGIKEISLIDNDVICVTNINRQIIATKNNIGKSKVLEFEKHIHSIDENIVVHTYPLFLSNDNYQDIPFEKFNYILDCIDTVASKLLLVKIANKLNKPIISMMGAANRMNPNDFMVTDIYKTMMDPLAKVMRYELRKLGIKKLKVIYSREKAITPSEEIDDSLCPYIALCGEKCSPNKKRKTLGSIAFVPSSAGLLLASEVIKDLIKE